MLNFLNDEKKLEKKFILFGASSGFYNKFINKYGIDFDKDNDILFACDNDVNKHGKKLSDKIPVFSPEKIKQYNPDEIMIVITSEYVRDISHQLIQMGYGSSIIYEHELSMLFFNKNKEQIQEVYNMLEDDKSKEVYKYVLSSRILNKIDYDFTPVCEPYYNQYFVKNMFKFTDEEVFVGAGGYDGDTIRQFLFEVNNKYKMIYSFEPGKDNYNALAKFVDNYNLSNKVKIFNKGIYNKEGFISGAVREDNQFTVRHFVDEGLGGLKKIPVCTIDNITNKYATFIQMDTEGSEIQALEGAKETIIKNKPKLAISIYHRISDYWRIPLLIKSYVDEYKFFVRHHQSNLVYDTILYAAVESDIGY